MPYEKLKSEDYTNFGGINQKNSQYVTEKTQFLDLRNVDTTTVGALSSMWGSTQFNLNYPIGLSIITDAEKPISGIHDFDTQIPNSYGLITFSIVACAQDRFYDITGGTFSQRGDWLYSGTAPFDFVRSNKIYGCNGYEFFSYSFGATTMLQYSVPTPYEVSHSANWYGTTGGLSGILTIYQAFQRLDGFMGPVKGITFPIGASYQNDPNFVGMLTGVSAIIFKTTGLNTTAGTNGVSLGSFGISGLQLWYSLNDSGPYPYGSLVAPYPDNPTFVITDTFSGWTTNANIPDPEEFSGTFLYGAADGTDADASSLNTENPSTIEIFGSRLFMSGFANFPDTFYWSEVGDFEKRGVENSAGFREGDGDVITNLVSYFTQLIIFKTSSIGALSGNSNDTFNLSEANNKYGCLSSRSAVVFEQKLWFLDEKGICEYNGANTTIVSNEIEPVFKRMNVPGARRFAAMIHVKQLNQVWCAIPVDGSYNCNLIVVHDYLSGSWFTREFQNIDYLASIRSSALPRVPFIGGISQNIYAFSPSLLTDNGAAFTCLIKSRYLNDLGNSVEKMFRRLFIDCDIASGASYPMLVNFYTNQATLPALTITFSMTEFQKRVDYGLSGKDLAVEFIYSGGNYFKLNGFTIEYRFQRNV